MIRNIRDLIDMLEEVAEAHGDDIEVRLAIQPRWAFEHSIDQVGIVPASKAGRRSKDAQPAVCYIAEGSQLGYLPGPAAVAVGWSEKDDDDNDEDGDDDEADDDFDGNGIKVGGPDHDTRDREGGDIEACPGCGCLPGDGRTADCSHPDGCGYNVVQQKDGGQ